MAFDIYQIVTDRIIAQLENGANHAEAENEEE